MKQNTQALILSENFFGLIFPVVQLKKSQQAKMFLDMRYGFLVEKTTFHKT